MQYVTRALLLSCLMGLPALTACDRNVSSHEESQTSPDGTVKTDQQTVKQDANGNTIKTDTKTVDKPQQ
jgi:hypothetical protein